MGLRVQFGEYNLGLVIWPFENDLVCVEAPQDNLPLLNNYIGVAHLLNLSILNCECEWGLIPLKKEEKPFLCQSWRCLAFAPCRFHETYPRSASYVLRGTKMLMLYFAVFLAVIAANAGAIVLAATVGYRRMRHD